MLSTIQKFTAQQAPNIYEHVLWQDLKPEEKRDFGIAFIDKALTDSEASDQLEYLQNNDH